MDAHRQEEERTDDPLSSSGGECEGQMNQDDETQMTDDDDQTQMSENDVTPNKHAASQIFPSIRGRRHNRIASDSDEDMGESSQHFGLDPNLGNPGQSSEQEDSMSHTQKSGNRDQKWGGKERLQFSPATSADNRGGSHARNVVPETAYDSDVAESQIFDEPVTKAFQSRYHVCFGYSDSESQVQSPESQDDMSQDQSSDSEVEEFSDTVDPTQPPVN